MYTSAEVPTEFVLLHSDGTRQLRSLFGISNGGRQRERTRRRGDLYAPQAARCGAALTDGYVTVCQVRWQPGSSGHTRGCTRGAGVAKRAPMWHNPHVQVPQPTIRRLSHHKLDTLYDCRYLHREGTVNAYRKEVPANANTIRVRFWATADPTVSPCPALASAPLARRTVP